MPHTCVGVSSVSRSGWTAWVEGVDASCSAALGGRSCRFLGHAEAHSLTGFLICVVRSPGASSSALSFLPQPGPITEVDGAVASDFFTVLSTGQHFTEDQWVNMQAFSMLRRWLLHSGPETPGSPDTGARGGTALRAREHKYAVAWVSRRHLWRCYTAACRCP